MSTLDMVQTAQVNEPKSTAGVFELPCGYLDPQGTLHGEVEVREITGAEEDMLAANQVPTNKKLNELITRCTVRLGTLTERRALSGAVLDLPVADRVFLMYAVRRVTLGDEYPFETPCPKCEKPSLYSINLAELETTTLQDAKKRVFDAVLPSGKSIRFRLLTGHDEMKLAKFSESPDVVTLGMLARTELYDGRPADLGTFKSLGMRERQAIRAEFDKVDPGVDTAVDVTCPKCGHDFKAEIDPGQQGFFFPSALPKG